MTAIAVACSASPSAAGNACKSAGGTCVIGAGCGGNKTAPDSAQDCSTTPGDPGGGVCCLDSLDSGSDSLDGAIDHE
jgi:hypothetical protein